MADNDSSFDEEQDDNDADIVHPFKLFKSKEHKDNDGGRLDLCTEYVQLLSSRDRCKSNTNSQKKLMSCNCLGFLNDDLHWEAAGNWMVDFGSMKRHDQQRVVTEKIRHADVLAETFDAGDQDSKKRRNTWSAVFLSS
jgi:hypothetical protein